LEKKQLVLVGGLKSRYQKNKNMGIDFSVERTCSNCKHRTSTISLGTTPTDGFLCEASKHFLRDEKQYRVTGRKLEVYNTCKTERKDWTITEKIQNRFGEQVVKRCGPDGLNFVKKDQLNNKPPKTLGNTIDMTRAPELAKVVDVLLREGCNQEDAERITEEISDIIYNTPVDPNSGHQIIWLPNACPADQNAKM
jgi:hypothetical protein